MSTSPLLRVEVVAVEKNVSAMTVRRALASGELVGVRIGRNVFVEAASVAGWRLACPYASEQEASR